jgi:hypothetical protein
MQAGQERLAVAVKRPAKDTPNMADDPHLREMPDPKFRAC